MKYLNKLWLGAFSLVALVSCTENSLLDYKVDKPGSLIGNEYLNEYDVLKSYVDRSVSSDFKLGAGVSVDAFNKQGTVYSHIISNFDEVTAGWAMKHGAVVMDDGRLDTASVKQFVAKAQEAGVSIYGHTLTWHANQNAKYLNSIIADKEIEIDPNNANNALHATTPEAKTDSWDWQLEYTLPTPLTQGVEYTLKMRAKASSAFTVDFWRTNGSSTDYGPNIAFGESWGDVSVTFTPTMDATRLQFCFGAFGGDLYFDDMVLTASGSEDNLIENGTFDDEDLSGWGKPGWHSYTFGVEAVAAGPATWWTNLVINSDVEGDDVSSFFATEVTVGPNPATIGAAGTGADGVGRAIVVKSGDNPTNTWDTQFFVKAPQQLEAGQAYRFSMKVKADKPATIASQSHNNPGGYIYWSMIGNPAVTTEWQEYSNSGVISAAQAGNNGMNTIAFNLAELAEANTYYFDDIVWEIEEKGNKIPLTPEEKADTLSWALDNWMAGMFKVTKHYIKAWDVVNEPMDDGNPSELKTGVGKTNMTADEFYWQDYLGKDYAVMAFNLAAQYGNPDDKLFINDYNLEYNIDKCKGLIAYVEYIEEQGARVDGIGTQMHINTNSDKDKIVEMFNLLAATGKLIKISELDIGIADGVTTTDATKEDLQVQAEMYKFVVEKYLELIPASQQYGITAWSPLDSPDDSSWRAGEPIGLWNESYYRKPAYAGFADGLSGE